MLQCVEGSKALRVATHCSGKKCRIIDDDDPTFIFNVSGRLLVGLSYNPTYTHPPNLLRELPPRVSPHAICVRTDTENDWTLDYRTQSPSPLSHPSAVASVYHYEPTRGGTTKDVRWNIPFMTAQPLFICSGPVPLRVWIDADYYEVETGTLVVMGPLLCEALIEDGPWQHPLRVHRELVNQLYGDTNKILPSALLHIVRGYLFPSTALEVIQTVAADAQLPLDTRRAIVPRGTVLLNGATIMTGDGATLLDRADHTISGMKVPKRLLGCDLATLSRSSQSSVSSSTTSQRPLGSTIISLSSSGKTTILTSSGGRPLPMPTNSKPTSSKRTRPSPPSVTADSTENVTWACATCTFVNQDTDLVCEICQAAFPKRSKHQDCTLEIKTHE
jgi:hypothetical protein